MQDANDIPAYQCEYGNGRFELLDDGVYFIGKDKEGKEKAPKWICSPLNILAKTRDEKSGEWGRLLKWRDDDGMEHQWPMPMEMLEGGD